MTHTPTPRPTDDAADRLIEAYFVTASENLAPSSGFTASVMDSVYAQATEPPLIAFPWRRILPGAIATLGGLVALIVFAMRAAKSSPAVTSSYGAIFQSRPLHASTPSQITLGAIVLTVCLSIAAIAASFRLAGRSE